MSRGVAPTSNVESLTDLDDSGSEPTDDSGSEQTREHGAEGSGVRAGPVDPDDQSSQNESHGSHSSFSEDEDEPAISDDEGGDPGVEYDM